jgi:hypothetical protein
VRYPLELPFSVKVKMSGYSTKAAGVRQKILGGSLQSSPPEEDGKNSQTLMGCDWAGVSRYGEPSQPVIQSELAGEHFDTVNQSKNICSLVPLVSVPGCPLGG